MLETRRGLYCDEAGGGRTGDFERVAGDIERAMIETLPALGWRQLSRAREGRPRIPPIQRDPARP